MMTERESYMKSVNSSTIHTTHRQYRRHVGNPARTLAESDAFKIVGLFGLHIVLALLMDVSSLVSTVHALITVLLGLHFLAKDEHPFRLICLVAYITGVELLWRGTGATIFWETGKYSSSLFLLFSLIKRRKLAQASKIPLIYFLLLLPSIALMPSFDRQAIAFALSGPLLLATAGMYFSTVELNETQLKRLLIWLLAPILGLGVLSAISVATADLTHIAIGSKATSADIDPNQVSSILGLGVFAASLLRHLEKKSGFVKLLMLLIVLWLSLQSALTFSRGGLYTGLLAMGVATYFLMRDSITKSGTAIGLFLIAIIGYFILLPFANNLTTGALMTRLQDTDMTGRDLIIQADLLVFRNNPIWGVGPGQSEALHALTFRMSAAHTEYSRLLAEHGSLGAVSLIILLGMASTKFVVLGHSTLRRGFAVGSVAWALLYMVHAAMRLAAPAIMFGLANIKLEHDEDSEVDMNKQIHTRRPRHLGNNLYRHNQASVIKKYEDLSQL